MLHSLREALNSNIDGSRGVPPDAVKPLVSTHLERMSLTRLLGIRARNY
jgi:hypothetical protein